ncbi:MAG: MFS transporter [Chroococcidiopsidaceae cyanobacterium CP_BM_ER_R8_30]|nr:MFS transporter [Chroococcidiopsidaceae cyanobacterium CP_BM_ER_R8_30]
MLPTEHGSSNQGFKALLGNKPFLALWSGQIMSQVADKVFFVLLIALLSEYPPLPGFQNSMRSALMIAFTLPAILFGSAAGIFVDRFGKKPILVGSNLIRAFLMLAIPVLPKEFAILLMIAFAVSTVTQFFAPAEQAAIPLLVRHENLMSANALFTTTMMGALIIGFAIGEPLLSLARDWNKGYGREILIGGLYFLAAIAIQLTAFRREILETPKITTVRPLSDLKAGLSYLRKNHLIWNALVQLTVLFSVFAALTVLAIDLAADIGLKPTQFGFLLAASGVGMVFGAAILGHWGDRWDKKPLSLIGFLSVGLVLGLFSFTKNLQLGLTLSALLGLGASLVAVPMQTLIQQQTPESMRGKVFGFQNNAINIALSLPLAITGPLTDAVSKAVGSGAMGMRLVLLAMGVLVSIVGLWAWRNTCRVSRI